MDIVQTSDTHPHTNPAARGQRGTLPPSSLEFTLEVPCSHLAVKSYLASREAENYSLLAGWQCAPLKFEILFMGEKREWILG